MKVVKELLESGMMVNGKRGGVLNNPTNSVYPGEIEIFYGGMKCGKTEEGVNRMKILKHVPGARFGFFKPKMDTREKKIRNDPLIRYFGENSEYQWQYFSLKDPQDLIQRCKNLEIGLIDEGQFLTREFLPVIEYLAYEQNMNLIIAGLNYDFKRDPFGAMPYLLNMAHKSEFLTAACDFPKCRKSAEFSQRLINGKPAPYDSPTVSIEGSKQGETYEARCRKHHSVPRRPKLTRSPSGIVSLQNGASTE